MYIRCLALAEARRGGDHIDWPEAAAAVAESVRHSVYSGSLKLDAYSTNYKNHYQLYGSAQQITPEWNERIKTPSFFDLGVKVTYDFYLFQRTTLQLFAAVNNIFSAFQSDYDLGPDRDSAYIYGPTMPASGYVGLKISL